jgi:hypothetical protein
MTVTLNLPPQIEQAYLAEAAARGLPLEDIVTETLIAAWRPIAQARPVNTDEWMRRFTAWSESAAHANLPDLPEDAMSRDSIYGDRGF